MHQLVLLYLADWPAHKVICRASRNAVDVPQQWSNSPKEWHSYVMELFAESRHEVVLAARSAFRFGTSACDELRRTHTLHVGFIFNPAGATVREGFIPVHAELVEKVKVNNPASLQAIGDEEREALEEAAQIQADHDAVALCFTISIFVKSAQSGEIKPVLTRSE